MKKQGRHDNSDEAIPEMLLYYQTVIELRANSRHIQQGKNCSKTF